MPPRVLAVPGALGLAHLSRLLLVGRALRGRGAEVTFAFREAHPLLAQEGFPVVPVTDVGPGDFGDRGLAAIYTPELVRRCVDDELRHIEALQPDILLGDLRPSLAISSRLARIPAVAVANGYMTDAFNIVDAMVERQASPIKHLLASAVTRAVQDGQKQRAAAPFRAVAEARGVAGLTSLYPFMAGDLTLLPDLPEFCPLEGLPPFHRYTGPLIWEESTPMPPWLAELDASRPLLYATIGNTGGERLLRLVLEAFGGDRGWQVVMTTGAYVDPTRLPQVANVRIERFVPGSAVLARAAAAVHCAGNGSTYQAIAARVPAVAVPFNADQRNNAWLLKRAALGRPLSPQTITAAALRQAVEEVRGDAALRERLGQAAAAPMMHGGPDRAADLILDGWRAGAGRDR